MINIVQALFHNHFGLLNLKKIVKLLELGKTESKIKALCLKENLFGAAKEYRARRMYEYIWNRVKQLDESLM